MDPHSRDACGILRARSDSTERDSDRSTMPAHVVRAANVAKIEMIWTENTKQWANIFHIGYGGAAPMSVADCADLATKFRAQYLIGPGFFVNPGCSTFDCHVTDIDPLGFASGDDFTITAGTNGGLLLPAQSAWVVTWHNNLPSFRGGKPKSFIGGMSDGDVTNARTITPASRANMVAKCNNFINGVNAITIGSGARTCQFVTLSVKSGGAFRPTPLQANITLATVGQQVRTQRRRIEP